jgi:hypothetical protein
VSICDEVRSHCAEIAANARWVRIDVDAAAAVQPAPPPALDPASHYLEGRPEDVATFLLSLDTINFGSGWFPLLRKRTVRDRTLSGYFTVAWALSDHFRAHGAWTAAELRTLDAETVATILGQRPDLELMGLYAQGLRALGRFLGERTVLDLVQEANGSAAAFARTLAVGMPMFNDVGFYKRALIAANDLTLGGVASFDDLDTLPIFADNLVPHVLRCDGVLIYEDRLAAHIDAGQRVRMGPAEREIRACAVHACEQIARRTGAAPRSLDGWLWHRGQAPEYKSRPRHRTTTVFY